MAAPNAGDTMALLANDAGENTINLLKQKGY